MRFRVAIDAINLEADNRGMGRYVRHILNDWSLDPNLDTTLLTRERTSEAKSSVFDAVWYPWNGIRFPATARKVVTVYDAFAFTEPHPQFIARWREQSPIKRAIHEAAALATISRWSARELARVFHIPAERFTIIPPVPDEFWQPVDSITENPVGEPYVLFVTGPDKRKNAKMLIIAFADAFLRKEAALVIVGNLRDKDAAQLTSLRNTHFHHLKPTDEELRILYSHALAVAVPSYAEGYGLPVVEAMACGAPVIAADAAALPEACASAAILLPPFDTYAWSRMLRQIAFNEDLRKRLRNQSLAHTATIDRTNPARATLALLQQPSADS